VVDALEPLFARNCQATNTNNLITRSTFIPSHHYAPISPYIFFSFFPTNNKRLFPKELPFQEEK